MKKIISIISIALVFAGIVAFALFTTEIGNTYISNYSKNFKHNMNTILKMMNIPVKEENEPSNYDKLVMAYEKEREEQKKAQAEAEANAKNEADANTSEAKKPNPNKTTEADSETEEKPNPKDEDLAVVKNSMNIAFENAGGTNFARYAKGILSATESSLSYYDKKGRRKWENRIQISSPVLRTNGAFILVYEKDGKGFTLFNGSKKLYSRSVKGTVRTASVSDMGDVSIVYDEESYKGSVAVYNKSGTEVYLWHSGKYTITDADISGTRRLAVLLLDVEKEIISRLYFFDINEAGPQKETKVTGSLVFDIDFDGEVLNAYADNAVYGFNSSGKKKWKYDCKDGNMTKYMMTENGTKLIAFDYNNASKLSLVSAWGKESADITIEMLPDFIDLYDNDILYNSERTIIISNFSQKNIRKYKCSRDIKKAYFIDSSNIFIVYGSSIEFLEIE